ncbi:phage minor head protein [Spirosoma foliorum]|uniref:Phage head morphogenesis domain-containing protein n=1 Tax=Spirosoma foliorum TaxID=2710596 RepID=A0A7G5H2H7_9BACT|nr:phage minor head protein [Spirosoma foliorum]QMW05319.1 hypothetical protein H3H32_10740 [Spirosoma foliorum]
MTLAQATTYHRQYLRWHVQQERFAVRVVMARFRQLAGSLIHTLNAGTPATLAGMIDVIVSTQAHNSILSTIYTAVGVNAAQREYERLLPQAKSAGVPMLTKDKDPSIPSLTPQSPKPSGNLTIAFYSQQWRSKMAELARSSETAARITKMTEKTRDLIRNVLADAGANGWSIAKIAKGIRNVVADKARALLIARTETTLAASAGHEAGAMTTLLRLEKKWIATADTRTRDAHLAMLNAKPVPRDGVFMVGGRQMKFPGDPNGGPENCCNCRCTLAYIPARNYLDN